MSNLRAAVSLIEDSRTDPDQFWRQSDWMWLGVVVLFGLILFIFSASSLSTAWHSEGAAAWDNFWNGPSSLTSGMANMLVVLLIALTGIQRFDPSRHQHARLIAARKAAIAGDDTCAPLAPEQPAATEAAALSSGPIAIGPLTRPRSSRDLAALVEAICLLIIAFITGIVTAGPLIALLGDPNAGSVGLGTLITAGITLACATPAAFLIHRYRRAGQPLTITVDGAGLHWRQPTGLHRQRHIEWSQARAFVTFSWRSESTYTRYLCYALMAPRLAFCWELTERATPEARQAQEKLAGLIAAYARLPLRDLTVALEVASAPASILTDKPKPKITFPLGTPGTPDAVPGIPTLAAASSTVTSRLISWRWLVRFGSLVMLVAMPTLLLYGTGFALRRVQPGYFTTLLTRSEALPPLYLDKLAQPDGDWLVRRPTTSDPMSLTYVHPTSTQGAYQLFDPDQDGYMSAHEPHSFSDVLVEVTARQVWDYSVVTFGGIGVGVILRERNNGNQFVEFQIKLSGDWELADYSSARPPNDQWDYIDSGQSAAIHHNAGDSNRIAILMRGDTYILYVNGVFIGAGMDTDIPANGAAGVYVESDAGGGQFSDFAVYPAYSGLPLII